jgi:hypothetical protein
LISFFSKLKNKWSFFRIKHQNRGKKDQQSPISPGEISNQQTDPGVGRNNQPAKLNGDPGKWTSRP